jgi:hypothetical protein
MLSGRFVDGGTPITCQAAKLVAELSSDNAILKEMKKVNF